MCEKVSITQSSELKPAKVVLNGLTHVLTLNKFSLCQNPH